MSTTPGRERQYGYDGFAQIAHAIRRVGALHEAVSLTPPEGTIEDVLETAERLALWLRGSAEDPADKPRWTAPEN